MIMNIKKFLAGAALLLCSSAVIYAQTAASPEITVEDLKSHISYLASDDLKGRYTGTPGSTAASEYIRDQFRKAGLELMGEEGFQNFEVVVRVSAGPITLSG